MKKKIFLPLILFSIITLNHLILERPRIQVSKQSSSLNFNQKYLKIFNLGFSNMVSSWLWVQTLLESDIEPYKKDDLNSWMFLRFSTITTIDPKFYEAYLFGGKYLSIIKDDVFGAEVIFKNGLKQFPDDFWLNINAAHNYFFEMGLPEMAYPLYKKVQFLPIAKKTFPILPSIVAKLEKLQGDPQVAFSLLLVALENQESEYFREYYEKSLYSLKAEIDLNCLNSGKQDCNRNDYFGNPYFKNNKGEFQSKISWKKFELSSNTLKRVQEKKRGFN